MLTKVVAYRLLDDNRELYVPDLGELVHPHSHFMLFATQNPAGAYGGRKVLSRALRSRFLELHVGDIPDAEVAAILERRAALAPSHAARLVTAMRELQRLRQVCLHSTFGFGQLHDNLLHCQALLWPTSRILGSVRWGLWGAKNPWNWLSAQLLKTQRCMQG